MANLKCVLVGCGAIAREHLGALAELKNVEVAAVCDISAARAQATAERFAIAKWFTDFERMISEIKPDMVHITTPPSAHFPLAKLCLDAGLNVLCEKPIAVEYKDFVVLKKLALANDCMLLENQNLRFHSSIQRIQSLISANELGDVLEVQIFLFLNLGGAGSPYIDVNAPHPGMVLRGGVVGDFLPHIAYLAHIFTGKTLDLRTIWTKHAVNSPLNADEFRGMIKGERATAFVDFSGNAQPNGFWVRVLGTQMCAETNLFEPPRLTVRRLRTGEPALMSLVDGLAEARDVLKGAVAGFWRKLAGTSSYDGLPEFIAQVYGSLERRETQPISLDEIDETARLVDSFTRTELKL
jgi:predicted dehydrogenase